MTRRHDLVVVGMGACGMTAAEFAVGLGLRVAAVERDRIGGDRLWTGCVPSKALLATAKAAHTIRTADRFGLTAQEPQIDREKVWARVRSVRDDIATTDDRPDRFTGLVGDLVAGTARLTGPSSVLVDGVRELQAKHVLLCTGSRPLVPHIPGLAAAGYLTSETLFELTTPPASITVIGGGPTGTELAQAFARLGIETTLVERAPRLLPGEEPVLAERLSTRLGHEGVDVRTSTRVTEVRRLDAATIELGLASDGRPTSVTCESVLVAAGRVPNLEGLGLEELGVERTPAGLVLDGRGRTSVRSIYAAGDCAGPPDLAHAAAHDGARAVRNMFFPGHSSPAPLVPWCTFTDPELAHAGLTIAEAEEAFDGNVEVWRFELDHNDRARADAETDGSIVVVTAKHRVVGAHVLAPAAGEMIQELSAAIRDGVRLGDLARVMHVYPTYSTSVAQLASEHRIERAQRHRWLLRR